MQAHFAVMTPSQLRLVRKWQASSRRIGLLTQIKDNIKTPQGDLTIKPYTSSGTLYSEFAIIQVGHTEYAFTRIVNSFDVQPPEDDGEENEPKE